MISPVHRGTLTPHTRARFWPTTPKTTDVGALEFVDHTQRSCQVKHAYSRQNGALVKTFAASTTDREIWIETTTQGVFTAALEAGATTFLFHQQHASLVRDWEGLGRFQAILVGEDGQTLLRQGQDHPVGILVNISSKEDLISAERHCSVEETVIMDANDWQIIPAEHLVAACQGQPARLLGVAADASGARVLLEALQTGTDGILLRTESAAEVRATMEYVRTSAKQAVESLHFDVGRVTRIEPVGMGDRVAVDLCSLLVPGEGLLVGSFAQGLFLVHSECCESRYINSREFRVNAGPVHAYLAMPEGKTAYLSELKSGSEVLVVDAAGRQRTAIVGRTKTETRPLVLVEVEICGEERLSILLQNAETVRLVGPVAREEITEIGAAHFEGDAQSHRWTPISVTELHEGNLLFVMRQEGARHTGVAIKEQIVER